MEEVWGQSILKMGGDIFMFVKSRYEIIWEKTTENDNSNLCLLIRYMSEIKRKKRSETT